MAMFFYARVSTSDQTIEHQRIQAEGVGFTFDHVLYDHGVSGVSVLLKDRPQGKRLFDMLRAGDTLVVRWIDRLGRNYQDVTETLREFMGRGVIIRTIINSMTFDGATRDPMQKAIRDALIGFMAASAEAQAEATKAAQRAGIDFHKAKTDAFRGRKPSFTGTQLETVRGQLALGVGVSEIANLTGLSRQTIYRIKDDPATADKTVALWQKPYKKTHVRLDESHP